MLVEFVVTVVVIGLTDVDVEIPFPVDVEPDWTVVVVARLAEFEVEARNKYRFYLFV